MRHAIVYLSGLVFSIGLIVSGMINPAKVLGFLDLFGDWDASLAFVMLGAVMVTSIGYSFLTKREKPVFALKFSIPSRTDIDFNLVLGPALFGIGWGLVGLCPGPAIAAVTASPDTTFTFFLSMLLGMFLVRSYRNNTVI